MTKPIVKLAPGRAGWYDEASRLHLTIANPEAVIEKGTNVTNVKKALHRQILLLMQGDLDSDDYIDNKKKIKPGKYTLNIDYIREVAEARKLKNKKPEIEEPETEEPEIEEPETEEPEVTEPEVRSIKVDKDDKDVKLSKDDKESVPTNTKKAEADKQEEATAKQDDDNAVLLKEATEVSKEISKKIENARAVSGVNGSIDLIEENDKLLSNIKGEKDKLLKLANDKKISIIKGDIEKAESKKDFDKVEKAILELDKKDQEGLLEELAKKQE